MADKVEIEFSGLPLIPEANGDMVESAGSVSITIGAPLAAQKSVDSEGAMLSEVDQAKMSSIRKRNGMKVVFRVRRKAASCLLGGTSGLQAHLLVKRMVGR